MKKTIKKKKEEIKEKVLTSFSADNYISFQLKKGSHTINLGTADTKGKDIAVYLQMESEELTACYSCDLISSCKEYVETRTIPTEVVTRWNYVPTNKKGATSLQIKINTISGHKDNKGLAKIKIFTN